MRLNFPFIYSSIIISNIFECNFSNTVCALGSGWASMHSHSRAMQKQKQYGVINFTINSEKKSRNSHVWEMGATATTTNIKWIHSVVCSLCRYFMCENDEPIHIRASEKRDHCKPSVDIWLECDALCESRWIFINHKFITVAARAAGIRRSALDYSTEFYF